LTKHYYGNRFEDEMNETCSIHGSCKSFTQIFGRKPRRKATTWET